MIFIDKNPTAASGEHSGQERTSQGDHGTDVYRDLVRLAVRT